MASLSNDNGGLRRIVVKCRDGQRRPLRLGLWSVGLAIMPLRGQRRRADLRHSARRRLAGDASVKSPSASRDACRM